MQTTTANVNVTNSYILSADADILAQLATILVQAGEMKQAQADKLASQPVEKQRVSIGTRYCNSALYGAEFAAGTLTLTLVIPAPADQEAPQQEQQARRAVKSAKEWLRELLSQPDASYTLKELCALTGKTEVNIRTMLSDLRSAKYAGKGGVFNTKSTRVNGVTRYSAA